MAPPKDDSNVQVVEVRSGELQLIASAVNGLQSEVSSMREAVGGLRQATETTAGQINTLFGYNKAIAEEGCAKGREHTAQIAEIKEHAAELDRCLVGLNRNSHPPRSGRRAHVDTAAKMASGGTVVLLLDLVWDWIVRKVSGT